MHNGIISGNTALFGGGGLALVNGVQFTMHNGVINGNAADTGGGIHVAGTGGLGASRFTMNGGIIGGPRGLYDDEGEPIINANTARYGGGVYVDWSAIFTMQGDNNKTIQGNDAEYDGGGVWVNETGTMQMQTTPAASNVHITHNTAGRMGGGIFTERHEYRCPLTRYPGSPLLGAQTVAYSNLTLLGVTFGSNTANRRYWPPSNATAVIGTGAFVASSTSQPVSIPDIRRHPLNNYDINFRVDLQQFDFLKTDEYLYAQNPTITLLPGAQFRLFRTVDPGLPIGTSGAYLVSSTGGILDPRWEEVIFTGGDSITYDGIVADSTSAAIPISFMMDPRHHYQLVEITAPPGYQLPMGQWRITFNTTMDIFNDPVVIGGVPSPAFIRSTATSLDGISHPVTPRRSNLFYLGNWRRNELPLTGGEGTNLFTTAGVTIMGVAGLTAFLLFTKKNGKGKDK